MDCSKKVACLAIIMILLSSSTAVFFNSDASDASASAGYDAEVTPFTFPESYGIPVMNTLKQAATSIDVSMYLLSSTAVTALLLEKQKEGVQVRILIEYEPEGIDISDFRSTHIMKTITEAGGEVHVINFVGCEEQRYTYLHNKYAVVDGETIIVTSENWASSNFEMKEGNRGWGVVVKSTGCAEYLEDIFEEDFSTTNSDVEELSEAFPNLTAYTDSTYYNIGRYDTSTYTAKVSVVCSPNAKEDLKAFVTSATGRLYSEQLDLDSDYLTETDNPCTWMVDKADEGIDTRFILNTNYDTAESHPYADIVNKLNNDTKVVASGTSSSTGFSTMHNKGVIADDKVMVGSMNWTENSIMYNREVDVIIDSEAVSDYFSHFFLEDLYTNYVQGGDKEVCYVTYDVDGGSTRLTYIKGDYVLLPADPVKASESVYSYTFSHWEGYTAGMKAENDITLTAVFDRHTVLEEYSSFIYIVAALGIAAALSLGYWYIRNKD